MAIYRFCKVYCSYFCKKRDDFVVHIDLVSDNKDNKLGFCKEIPKEEVSQMIRIAICDDEKYFCEREKDIIFAYMKKRNIPCEIDFFLSGRELLDNVNMVTKYQIVFLDVSMDGLDGIETARMVRKLTSEVYLVFVTAFVTYALEGYKVDATRYIIKDEDSLENSIEECLDAIFLKIGRLEQKVRFVFREGVKELQPVQIMYIESNLHRLFFHMAEKEKVYTMNERLDVVAEMLEPYRFSRIHKSYLVNMEYVEAIGRYRLRLYDGEVINIAKPRYPQVRSDYMTFRGEI